MINGVEVVVPTLTIQIPALLGGLRQLCAVARGRTGMEGGKPAWAKASVGDSLAWGAIWLVTPAGVVFYRDWLVEMAESDIERNISIVFFTTEFDFTKGFAQWHVCWPIERLAVGIWSRVFKTQISNDEEDVRNRWMLEMVKSEDLDGAIAIRLKSVKPRMPTPAVIRLALFADETTQPVFNTVGYTVFSTYAPDYVYKLPTTRAFRNSGMQRGAPGGAKEVHCWLSLPMDLVNKLPYYHRVVRYVFGRELSAYQAPSRYGYHRKRRVVKERDALRVDMTVVEDGDKSKYARTDQMAISDSLVLACVFERLTDDDRLNLLLKPFVKSEREQEHKRKQPRWPISPWYQAVMIACFTSDRHRRNQWNAIRRNHCTTLAQVKSICMVQLGAVSEPCCAPVEIIKACKEESRPRLRKSQLRCREYSNRRKRNATRNKCADWKGPVPRNDP